MSLVRLAVRLCAVRALLGKTWAGDCVYDSSMTPIDEKAQEVAQPFIVIYTDDSERPSLSGNSQSVSLVLEIGITARMDGSDEWVIPRTDAGIELSLDLMERQILTALASPEDPWSDVLKQFITSAWKVSSLRGTSADKGVRFAGRQITVKFDALADPAFGKAPSGIWSRLLNLMSEDVELQSLTPSLQAAFGESDWPDWKIVQGRYVLPKSDLLTMQLGVPADLEEGEPVTFAESLTIEEQIA